MLWYLKALVDYATFRARSSRAEYWNFVLFNIIFFILATQLDTKLGIRYHDPGYSKVTVFYFFATLLPSLAVLVRRLHDVGKNGWWIFICLVPFIGPVWLFVLLVRDSEPSFNLYGLNPVQLQRQIEEDKIRNEEAIKENGNGLSALAAKRFEEALECFDRALKARPHDGVLYSNKGIALNELKRNDEAVECYSRAIALHDRGGAPEDWNNKGKALLELGKYEQALASYETAIQIRGLQTLDVLSSLYGKAEALAGLGKYAEAIEALNLELSLRPDLPKVIKRRDEFIQLNSNAHNRG